MGTVLAGAGAGAAGAAVLGAAVGAALTPLEEPTMKKEERRQSRARATATTQVPFSRTSVVCFTPMNWLLNPAMLPARPPPLGFWIRMNKLITAVRIMISTRNKYIISQSF